MLGNACSPELGFPEHLCGPAGARELSRSPLVQAAGWWRTAAHCRPPSAARRRRVGRGRGEQVEAEDCNRTGRTPLPQATLCRLAPSRGRRSPGPLPGHLCAGWLARESPDPRTNPLRVSDSWPGPWRQRGEVGSFHAHHPSPSSGEPRASPGGIPEAGGGPRAWREEARPLLPSPAQPCHCPAPLLQSGFCGARRPAPRLRDPRGGWLGARRGWRCAPPRLHCCAPGAQGSHAPRAPSSRPPGGSAVR